MLLLETLLKNADGERVKRWLLFAGRLWETWVVLLLLQQIVFVRFGREGRVFRSELWNTPWLWNITAQRFVFILSYKPVWGLDTFFVHDTKMTTPTPQDKQSLTSYWKSKPAFRFNHQTYWRRSSLNHMKPISPHPGHTPPQCLILTCCLLWSPPARTQVWHTHTHTHTEL